MSARPNLVFFLSDQLRWDHVGAYGNDRIRTPRLDALAKESVLFRRAYCTQPVCTPSRGTIVTGLYPHNHGAVGNNVPLSREARTIAEMVDGYTTAYMGKWHLGDEIIAQHGFSEWLSTEEYKKHLSRPEYKTQNCSYYHFLRQNGFMPDKEVEGVATISRDFATRVPERFSKPAYVAAEASRFIAEHREDPFILFVTFLEPHPPYYSVYDDMYHPDWVDLPPCFDADLAGDKPSIYHLIRRYAYEHGRHQPLRDESDWRRLIARYWGATTLVDTYVGVVLDALRQNGVDERTVVAFTSDHGDMMGDFRMIQKGVIHDSASRVPMMVKIPSLTDSGLTIDEPVSQVDLVPTLLEAMGVSAGTPLDGKSLLPAIDGRADLSDNDVFVEWNLGKNAGEWATHFSGHTELDEAVRNATDADWRGIVSADGRKLVIHQAGEHELYDVNDDPLERTNLYHRADRQTEIAELRRRIVEWQAKTNDQMELPEPQSPDVR